MAKRERTYVLVVLLLAAAFRIGYAFLVWTPIGKSPQSDYSMSVMYVRSAYLLAAGKGYKQALPGSPAYADIERLREDAEESPVAPANGARISELGLYPETLHPPGWSIIAAGIHRILKVPVWFPMQIFGILCDLLTCFLVYLLGRRIWKEESVARWAMLIYALFPPAAYAAVNLDPTGITSLFVTAAAYSFVVGAQRSGKTRMTAWALCGVAIGIGGYFRPDYLLLGPFLVTALWISERRFWRPVATGLGILVISLVVLLPWSLRNRAETGRWIFTSSSVGCTLVTGLGTFPNPWGFGPSDVDREREAAAQGIDTPFGIEADSYFRTVFLEAIREHPGAYLGIVLRRTWQPIATPYDWGIVTKGRKRSFTDIRSRGQTLSQIPYIIKAFWPRLISAAVMLLSVLASVFMVVRERKRLPIIIVVLLVPAYAALSHILTHMAPYYLLPGAFGQLLGLAYVASGAWKRLGVGGSPSTTTVGPGNEYRLL